MATIQQDCRGYDKEFAEWSKNKRHGDKQKNRRELHRKWKEGGLKLKQVWKHHVLASKNHNAFQWRYKLWQKKARDAKGKLEEADRADPDSTMSGTHRGDIETLDPRPGPETPRNKEAQRVTPYSPEMSTVVFLPSMCFRNLREVV